MRVGILACVVTLALADHWSDSLEKPNVGQDAACNPSDAEDPQTEENGYRPSDLYFVGEYGTCDLEAPCDQQWIALGKGSLDGQNLLGDEEDFIKISVAKCKQLCETYDKQVIDSLSHLREEAVTNDCTYIMWFPDLGCQIYDGHMPSSENKIRFPGSGYEWSLLPGCSKEGEGYCDFNGTGTEWRMEQPCGNFDHNKSGCNGATGTDGAGCNWDPVGFNAGWGDCSTYAEGNDNHDSCLSARNKAGLRARDCCEECEDLELAEEARLWWRPQCAFRPDYSKEGCHNGPISADTPEKQAPYDAWCSKSDASIPLRGAVAPKKANINSCTLRTDSRMIGQLHIITHCALACANILNDSSICSHLTAVDEGEDMHEIYKISEDTATNMSEEEYEPVVPVNIIAFGNNETGERWVPMADLNISGELEFTGMYDKCHDEPDCHRSAEKGSSSDLFSMCVCNARNIVEWINKAFLELYPIKAHVFRLRDYIEVFPAVGNRGKWWDLHTKKSFLHDVLGAVSPYGDTVPENNMCGKPYAGGDIIPCPENAVNIYITHGPEEDVIGTTTQHQFLHQGTWARAIVAGSAGTFVAVHELGHLVGAPHISGGARKDMERYTHCGHDFPWPSYADTGARCDTNYLGAWHCPPGAELNTGEYEEAWGALCTLSGQPDGTPAAWNEDLDGDGPDKGCMPRSEVAEGSWCWKNAKSQLQYHSGDGTPATFNTVNEGWAIKKAYTCWLSQIGLNGQQEHFTPCEDVSQCADEAECKQDHQKYRDLIRCGMEPWEAAFWKAPANSQAGIHPRIEPSHYGMKDHAMKEIGMYAKNLCDNPEDNKFTFLTHEAVVLWADWPLYACAQDEGGTLIPGFEVEFLDKDDQRFWYAIKIPEGWPMCVCNRCLQITVDTSACRSEEECTNLAGENICKFQGPFGGIIGGSCPPIENSVIFQQVSEVVPCKAYGEVGVEDICLRKVCDECGSRVSGFKANNGDAWRCGTVEQLKAECTPGAYESVINGGECVGFEGTPSEECTTPSEEGTTALCQGEGRLCGNLYTTAGLKTAQGGDSTQYSVYEMSHCKDWRKNVEEGDNGRTIDIHVTLQDGCSDNAILKVSRGLNELFGGTVTKDPCSDGHVLYRLHNQSLAAVVQATNIAPFPRPFSKDCGFELEDRSGEGPGALGIEITSYNPEDQPPTAHELAELIKTAELDAQRTEPEIEELGKEEKRVSEEPVPSEERDSSEEPALSTEVAIAAAYEELEVVQAAHNAAVEAKNAAQAAFDGAQAAADAAVRAKEDAQAAFDAAEQENESAEQELDESIAEREALLKQEEGFSEAIRSLVGGRRLLRDL